MNSPAPSNSGDPQPAGWKPASDSGLSSLGSDQSARLPIFSFAVWLSGLRHPQSSEVPYERLKALIAALNSGGDAREIHQVDQTFATQVRQIGTQLSDTSDRGPYTRLADILNLAKDHIHNMPKTMAALRDVLQNTYESLAPTQQTETLASRPSFLRAISYSWLGTAVFSALCDIFGQAFRWQTILFLAFGGAAWLLSRRADPATTPPTADHSGAHVIDWMTPVWEAALNTPAAPEVTEQLLALEDYDLAPRLLALGLHKTLKYLCPIRGHVFSPSQRGQITLLNIIFSGDYDQSVRSAAVPIIERAILSPTTAIYLTLHAKLFTETQLPNLSEEDQFHALDQLCANYLPFARPAQGIYPSPAVTVPLNQLEALYHSHPYHPKSEQFKEYALILRSIWTTKSRGELAEKPENPSAVISYLRDIEDHPELGMRLIRLVQEQVYSSILSGLTPQETFELDEPSQRDLLIMAGRSTIASLLLRLAPLSEELQDIIAKKAKILTKAIKSQHHQTGPLELPNGVSTEDAAAILSLCLFPTTPSSTRSENLRTALNALNAARRSNRRHSEE